MDENTIDENKVDDNDEYIINEIVNISEDINILMKDYENKKKNYKSNHPLTKFERTRVLSERTTMLSNNAPALIANPQKYSSTYDIALQEFNENKLPFIIKRPYGNTFEYWKLIDLMKK